MKVDNSKALERTGASIINDFSLDETVEDARKFFFPNDGELRDRAPFCEWLYYKASFLELRAQAAQKECEDMRDKIATHVFEWEVSAYKSIQSREQIQ